MAGHPGPHRPAEHRGAPGVPARPRVSQHAQHDPPPRSDAARPTATADWRMPAGRRTSCSAIRTRRKARLGGLAGLQDPAIMEAKRKAERESARRPWPTIRSCATRATPGTKSTTALAAWSQIYVDYDALRARHGLQHRAVRDRPHAGAAGRGIDQAERRSAARICRGRPRFAQAATVLRSADLPRPGNGQAGRFAQLPDGARPAPKTPSSSKSWPTCRPPRRAAQLVSGTKLADVAVSQATGRGRRKRDRQLRRSDDRAGAHWSTARPARCARPTKTRSKSRCGRPTPRSPRPASPSKATNTYPDATFTLRLAFGQVKGYEEQGKQTAALDHDGRNVHARRRARQRAALRAARQLAQGQGQAQSRHAVQLRQHGRHHRRQLRQPGGQPRRRSGGHHLRRQHPVAGARLRLHRPPGPRHLGALERHHRSAAKDLRRRRTWPTS